ncbi:MAG: cardiolipin synthase B [Syntrophus sp. RIFOXYC2_FULL_54_9]|nr:MAG: cardiolipin synthase B [Syntrophus sp. RIFOXYC2_FULL_54_9]HBB18753.1 cardiolipin synthase B [Syntrophus sp. (in: bacteria)]
MATENRFRQKSRLLRIMRLLRQFRPDLPVTYRHNRVLLFPRGHSFFRSLHTSLRSAERFILAEFYMIHADHTGAAFATELAEAVRRGVRVWLIYDYVGCITTPASFFEGLARQGIDAIPFNVPSFKKGLHWFDRRDHHKMVIIDGSLAYLGGFNIGDEYSGMVERSQRFRDLGLSISGDAVSELTRNFSEIWQMARGELPQLPLTGGDADPHPRRSGHADVSIVSGGPHHRRSYIRSAFLLNIASAAKEILIATPYFVPGPRMIRSLLRAARRGVKVRLLLPERSDLPLVMLLGRSYYDALLRKGIEIRELGREILHAKVMLIDGERTVIGSANLDQRSFHRNYELNSIIEDMTFGRQVKKVLLKDFANSRRVTVEGHQRRGVIARFLEKVINLFGWFL